MPGRNTYPNPTFEEEMSSQRAPIVTEGLIRRFGKIEAVAGVDFHVESGEVFGFLGPNGAGKSTTVRMLTTPCRRWGDEAS